jgi:hypothetical protein
LRTIGALDAGRITEEGKRLRACRCRRASRMLLSAAALEAHHAAGLLPCSSSAALAATVDLATRLEELQARPVATCRRFAALGARLGGRASRRQSGREPCRRQQCWRSFLTDSESARRRWAILLANGRAGQIDRQSLSRAPYLVVAECRNAAVADLARRCQRRG